MGIPQGFQQEKPVALLVIIYRIVYKWVKGERSIRLVFIFLALDLSRFRTKKRIAAATARLHNKGLSVKRQSPAKTIICS